MTGWISSSSENSVFSQSDLAVIAMATVHLSLSSLRSQTAEVASTVAMTTIHLFPIAKTDSRATAPVVC